MKFCSISDLHIKKLGDLPSSLFEKFINSNQVRESDSVFFLGDIFDFMVGNHLQYLRKFNFFFDAILKLIKQGKKVYYIEGNHDFHIERIMKEFSLNNDLNTSQFYHSKRSIHEIINNKNFYFSHGHEIDENRSYQNWKKIYSSKPFKIFIDSILPYKLVEKLGNKASKDSKKRGMQTFIYEKSQEMYRHGAKLLIEKESIDFLITGHTHIAENLTIGKSIYTNNGFPQESKLFIYFDGEKMNLIDLS